MPVIIQLTFPAGRYHATPWGRHVNEGVPEWPPSPWRLLRALVAVWKRTCPAIPDEQIRRILEPLTAPPCFRLPPFRVAHTRHYMPWEKKGPASRALVFDTFVSVGRHNALLVGWSAAEVFADDRAVLARLLGNLTSLGRAEGWVHAELLEENAELPLGPADVNDPNPVPILCPDPASAFTAEYYPTIVPKKPTRGKVKPGDLLFDCPRWHLCLDTETIHQERWPTVPGTKWVNYTRPTEASTVHASPRFLERQKPTVARFLIDGPVLPLVTDTLRVAEAFRHALLTQFQRDCHREKYGRAGRPYEEQFRSEVLSGKDAAGHPLRQHRHAYYLPTAEGKDPRWLTHVTVAATDGFGPAEVAALNTVRTLHLDEATHDLRLQLIGLGERTDFRAPLLDASTEWVSATPFVVTRYPKLRGRKRDRPEDYASPRDFAQHILEQELGRRTDLPAVERSEVEEIIGPQRLRPIQFQRFRRKSGDDGGRRPAAGFRITFAAKVCGPLAVGHSCHFGLGLFVPASAAASREPRS